MNQDEEITYKTAWEHFNSIRHLTCYSHFTDRLKERYGIELSKEEYFQLSTHKYLQKNYQGHSLSSVGKSVGTLNIKGIKVWCAYDRKNKLFVTAFPKEIGSDIYEMIFSFFKGRLKLIALEIYKEIESEVNNSRYDFNSDKEAALYYWGNGINFPGLCMDKFKHGEINKIKACHAISSIITGENPYVSICLKKKQLDK